MPALDPALKRLLEEIESPGITGWSIPYLQAWLAGWAAVNLTETLPGEAEEDGI